MDFFMDLEGVVGLVEHNRPSVLVNLDKVDNRENLVPLVMMGKMEILHLLHKRDLQVKVDLRETPEMELKLENLDKQVLLDQLHLEWVLFMEHLLLLE